MDARGIEPKETVPASRKLGVETATAMAREAGRIIVAKGGKLLELEGGSAGKATVSRMLGPTGLLRAPTVRTGRTVLVGFDEQAWTRIFG